MAGFAYSVGDLDRVIEEKGNRYMSMRMIKWTEADDTSKEYKLDIRKYYTDKDGNEKVTSNGISFATKEGPHELTRALIEENYGHTEDIIEALQKRDDFMPSLSKALDPDQCKELGVDPSSYQEGDYYDPREELFKIG